MKPDHTLDATGLKCPDPTLNLRAKIRTMKPKETILVLTDDVGSTRDIPKYCVFMEHRLLESKTDKTPYSFLVQKGTWGD